VGEGETRLGWEVADDPYRTINQSSSNHFQVAILFTLLVGSDLVGAGKIIEAAAGSGNDAGGDAGRRWESHQLGLSCGSKAPVQSKPIHHL